jgi:hypothetical protein
MMVDPARAPKVTHASAPKPWYANTPKLWRIRGKSRDGLVVTLGRYETEPQAQVELQRYTQEGYYRKLELQAITPPPPSATPTPFRIGRPPESR